MKKPVFAHSANFDRRPDEGSQLIQSNRLSEACSIRLHSPVHSVAAYGQIYFKPWPVHKQLKLKATATSCHRLAQQVTCEVRSGRRGWVMEQDLQPAKVKNAKNDCLLTTLHQQGGGEYRTQDYRRHGGSEGFGLWAKLCSSFRQVFTPLIDSQSIDQKLGWLILDVDVFRCRW